MVHVGLQVGFGRPGFLEEQPVVLPCACGLPHHVVHRHALRQSGDGRYVGHAQRDDRAEHVGTNQRAVPGRKGAPVVAHDDRLLLSCRGDHSHHSATILLIEYASTAAGALIPP